ncbi:MAG: hypothetical protein QW117_03365 [Candidatus Pacearchaeota archaeon]
MEVILDTNFILECIKNKIDLSDLQLYGKIIIPIQSIKELDFISRDKRKSIKDKNNAIIALKIIELKNFSLIDLKKEKVDEGIIDYVKNKKDVIIATLDRELKNKISDLCKILSIRNKKKIVLL